MSYIYNSKLGYVCGAKVTIYDSSVYNNISFGICKYNVHSCWRYSVLHRFVYYKQELGPILINTVIQASFDMTLTTRIFKSLGQFYEKIIQELMVTLYGSF